MRLESCREDSIPIFRARVAGQRDRGKKTSVVGFVLANLTDQSIAILIRQADVAHQDVGTLHFERLQRFPDRRHRFHGGARLHQQQERQSAPVGAVIDDQDA